MGSWTGSSGGTAIITDGNGVLTDDGGGGGPNETANADITIDGGASDIGAGVEAERVWTLFDTVTSQTFQIAHFDVDSGPAAGNYLLSEYALVSGRVYDVVGFDGRSRASRHLTKFAGSVACSLRASKCPPILVDT